MVCSPARHKAEAYNFLNDSVCVSYCSTCFRPVFLPTMLSQLWDSDIPWYFISYTTQCYHWKLVLMYFSTLHFNLKLYTKNMYFPPSNPWYCKGSQIILYNWLDSCTCTFSIHILISPFINYLLAQFQAIAHYPRVKIKISNLVAHMPDANFNSCNNTSWSARVTSPHGLQY